MRKKQFYGIKFPFTSNNNDCFFIDLNENIENKLASEILHVILTQKGTRIRKPEFGTNLIKYIFGQNDEEEWNVVQRDIMESVNRVIPDVTIKKVSVTQDENNDNNIMLDIHYTYKKGESEAEGRIATTI